MLKTLAVILLLAQASTPLPRSRAVIRDFAKATGHPNGWKDHVVDHQIPLCAGGLGLNIVLDAPENLQWQEVHQSYVKDAFERELCKDMARLGLVMVKQNGK